MISTFSKCFVRLVLVLATICIVVVGGCLFSSAYISDGREYTKSDWFAYYILTPSLIRNAPEASENAAYHVQGGDEHQNEEEEVVWTNVKDVPGAVKKLEHYLAEKGIDAESEYQRGNKYFVMHYNDVVVFRIGKCKYACT